MTNLEKWKAEKIKEIQEMDVEEVAEYIRDHYLTYYQCKHCVCYEKDKKLCRETGCKNGIKKFLKEEEQGYDF